jgi:MFS family permease
MPMGASHPGVGYCVYFGIKLAGYSAAAAVIGNYYERRDRNPLLVGTTRTVIGVVVGVAYWLGLAALLSAFPPPERGAGLTYLAVAGLIPVRLAEWQFLIWLFYNREWKDRHKRWTTSAIATGWSFLLDIPAIIGLIMTSGIWIC